MKKICIVTGSRAEYGLFLPLLKQLKKSKRFRLQLIVTGTHLEPAFGNSWKEIAGDGFDIDAKVRINSSGNSQDIATSASLALKGLSEAYIKLKPDLIVLLGDRYEILSAAFAAHISHIPIAHIHGGELTEGSLDDAMRHAITKLATLHFAAAEPYRKRIIQMGEHPSLVYNVGAPGLENVRSLKLLSKKKLEQALSIQIHPPFAVVTMHPATNEDVPTGKQTDELLKALQNMPGLQILMTYPNADADGAEIIRKIEKFHARHRQRCHLFKNLGTLNYLSLLQFADVVIGNSSSGIIEAPEFKIPTVNIGMRQQSRLAAKSVIHVMPDSKLILAAIKKALSPAFRKICSRVVNPYSKKATGKAIIDILGNYKDFSSIRKKFYDL